MGMGLGDVGWGCGGMGDLGWGWGAGDGGGGLRHMWKRGAATIGYATRVNTAKRGGSA